MIRDVLRGRVVLVLEDSYFIAEDLCAAIEQAGGRVLGPASHVEEALALLLKRDYPDAAILDIDLNGSQSFSVADALAKRKVPILFVTGLDLPALPHAHRKIPVCRKPMRAAEVVRALTRLLA
ncbi:MULTISPECIES: response regulator [Sphingomonas]|uniref:Response regulator n=1 Tax=Sphingomonas molluscorum TaxID=418184 RepID=A0ABU8Q0V6_9SPHN|nr:response regulator [Sphingomonas sp. JUb134]MBM7404728.1 DNA-binding response OmpR family regulator [Sphingomonas sp. JUb134]